ncbi:hypothetical protein [Devosia enhydra]|nr:hypothetical protein [Devosia enhydra]
MAMLFYVLGWIGTGLGVLMTGISMVSTIMAIRWSESNLGYGFAELLIRAAPALWLILGGLFVLAIGRILARLDEIALNTAVRTLDDDPGFPEREPDY